MRHFEISLTVKINYAGLLNFNVVKSHFSGRLKYDHRAIT